MKSRNVVNLFDYAKKIGAGKDTHVEKASIEMEQLSLPFPSAHSLLMLMSADFKSSDDFLRFSAATLPLQIFDMRVAPRLDFIGTNRSHSFNVLKSLNIEYKDMLGRLDINAYDNDIQEYTPLWNSLISNLDSMPVNGHPVLLFFDDVPFRSLCNRQLSHLYEIALLDSRSVEEISQTEQMRM